jgi:hypothetical protein
MPSTTNQSDIRLQIQIDSPNFEAQIIPQMCYCVNGTKKPPEQTAASPLK